jgi:hypothetical protein
MGKWLARALRKEELHVKKYVAISPTKPTELDILNPKIKKTPDLALLTEIELEAFNGWYATMRKPNFNLSHEEATQKAWELLIESMESMYKRGGGRYSMKRNEEIK